MATNLNLDDRLVLEAKELGGHRTKRDAVNHALVDYVNRMKRKNVVGMFDELEWDPEYDYKALRGKR